MNILVIGPSWVGDMIMSHTLYQQLKENYPDCEIDVMAPDWCRPLLDRMPEVRQSLVMPIGHGELSLYKRFELAKNLRGRYDLAIVLPNSFKSALIPFFAKVPERRGWKGEMRYGVLTDLRQNRDNYPMMVQRYIALAFEADKVPPAHLLPMPMPYLGVNPAHIDQTKAHFADVLQKAKKRPIIGFCPGAEFGPAKQYPHYHFGTLAERLIERGCAVALFGSKNDRDIADKIIRHLPEEMREYCLDFVGKTELNQAVDLLTCCKVVVSNDSGLMHIASALHRPLVALYGPTSPNYTPPLSPMASILRLANDDDIKSRKGNQKWGYHQSMIDISPEMVYELVMESV